MKLMTPALSFVACALFLSSPAFSLTSLKGEAMPVAGFTWTGFYAGLNAGLLNHTMTITDNQATSFLGTINQVSNPKLTGGIQVGFRRQLDCSTVTGVYGLELSANFSDAEFNKVYGSPYALYQLNSNHELKVVGLAEWIGGIAANRTLLFLAAGLSWTYINGNTVNDDSIAFFNGFNVDKRRFGTVLGAGIEYAFTDVLSARFKVDVINPSTYSVSDNTNDHFQIANNIVQGTVGLNYKFA